MDAHLRRILLHQTLWSNDKFLLDSILRKFSAMSASASATSIKSHLRDAFATSLSVDGVEAMMFRMIDTFVPYLHEPHQAFIHRLRGANSYRNELNAILKRFRKTEEKRGKAELAMAKEATKNARIAFSGCLVLLAYENCRSSLPSMLFESAEFWSMYATLGHGEYLVSFRNFMAVSLCLEPAKNNKALHLDICARLSERSSDVRYVTGSGQSRATQQRVAIYEREGNVQPEPSRKAKRTADVSDTSSEEGDSISSSKRSRRASISSNSSISSEGSMSALAGDFTALVTLFEAPAVVGGEVLHAHSSADVYCDDLVSELGDQDVSSIATELMLDGVVSDDVDGDRPDRLVSSVLYEFDELDSVLGDEFLDSAYGAGLDM